MTSSTPSPPPFELRIAPRKPDGTLRGAVPIWVVRHRADLYVRSYKGGGAAWYRGTQATHAGHIESGGVGKDVTFADETDPGLGDALDAAYRSKYRNYSPSIVGPMLTEQARGAKRRTVASRPRLAVKLIFPSGTLPAAAQSRGHAGG